MNKYLSSCLIATSLSILSMPASSETILRFAHIWPATSDVQTKIFDVWAKSVSEESNGELKVELYPSQTLVKASRAYDGAANGLADISAVVQGYNAGRFPLSEIVQLPGVSKSANQGACILQSLYDEGDLDKEYKDTHVLFMFTTGPAYIHTRDKEVKNPSDLNGLKIRQPSVVAGEMLKQMGAMPIGIPAPGIFEAVERNVVDGLSFPFEAMKVFRVNELVKYHLQIPYYTGDFVVTMNKHTYNRLSPEMKKVIDNNSGMKWSLKAAKVFDQLDKEGLMEAKSQGDVLNIVDDPLNDPKWGPPLNKGIQSYLDMIKERGNPTAWNVYKKALSLGSQCLM